MWRRRCELRFSQGQFLLTKRLPAKAGTAGDFPPSVRFHLGKEVVFHPPALKAPELFPPNPGAVFGSPFPQPANLGVANHWPTVRRPRLRRICANFSGKEITGCPETILTASLWLNNGRWDSTGFLIGRRRRSGLVAVILHGDTLEDGSLTGRRIHSTGVQRNSSLENGGDSCVLRFQIRKSAGSAAKR